MSETNARSYADILKGATSLGRGLRHFGLNQGARVVLILPNTMDYVHAFFGTLLAGGVPVPLDARWPRKDLEYALRETKPEAIIAADNAQNFAIRAGITTYASEQTGTRVFFRANAPGDALDLPLDTLSIDELVEAGANIEIPSPVCIGPEDLAAIIYSTGTTGHPHGVLHTHDSLLACVDSLNEMYRSFFASGLTNAIRAGARLLVQYRAKLLRAALRRRVWLTPLPFSAIAGTTLLLQGLLTGAVVVTQERFHPTRLLEAIERHRVTIVPLTPTMGELLLRAAERYDADCSSLLVIGLGGSQASPDLARRLKAKFRCAVAIGYGSTELGGGILATNLADDDALQTETVGRPFPGAEVRVVNESREEVPYGTIGELACRGGGLMRGYLNDSDGTGAVTDENRWYYTGDLAVMDDHGYVRLVGRKRDLIIRGAHKVYPGEIEGVLEQHPAIRRAAVIGLPDPLAGERVGAFVELETDADVEKDDLRAHCAHELAPYKVPDHISIIEKLPVTPDGKVRKFLLKRETIIGTPSREDDGQGGR